MRARSRIRASIVALHGFSEVGQDLTAAHEHSTRRLLSSWFPQRDIAPFLTTSALELSDGARPSQDVTFLPEGSLEKSPTPAQNESAVTKLTHLRHCSASIVAESVEAGSQTLPASDVLQWDLEDGSRLIIRPSGTEPKIKAYCFACGNGEIQARAMLGCLEVAAYEMIGM